MIAAGWFFLASELFADIFEGWLLGNNGAARDSCQPKRLNSISYRQDHITRVNFIEGISAADVREKTYALYAMGLNGSGPDSGTSTRHLWPTYLWRYQ